MYITMDGLCWKVPVTTKSWFFIHFHPKPALEVLSKFQSILSMATHSILSARSPLNNWSWKVIHFYEEVEIVDQQTMEKIQAMKRMKELKNNMSTSLRMEVSYIDMGVSKNRGTPKSSILIGFSIIFTIHFGVPLFLETPRFFLNMLPYAAMSPCSMILTWYSHAQFYVEKTFLPWNIPNPLHEKVVSLQGCGRPDWTR